MGRQQKTLALLHEELSTIANKYIISELEEAMAGLEGADCFWVVLCKNRGVHNRYNHFSRHAIDLAETDEVSSPPQIGALTVRSGLL